MATSKELLDYPELRHSLRNTTHRMAQALLTHQYSLLDTHLRAAAIIDPHVKPRTLLDAIGDIS